MRQNKVIGTELSEIKFTSMSLAEGLFSPFKSLEESVLQLLIKYIFFAG